MRISWGTIPNFVPCKRPSVPCWTPACCPVPPYPDMFNFFFNYPCSLPFFLRENLRERNNSGGEFTSSPGANSFALISPIFYGQGVKKNECDMVINARYVSVSWWVVQGMQSESVIWWVLAGMWTVDDGVGSSGAYVYLGKFWSIGLGQ